MIYRNPSISVINDNFYCFIGCVYMCGRIGEGGKESSGESDACSARGHESAKEGVGSKRSVLS